MKVERRETVRNIVRVALGLSLIAMPVAAVCAADTPAVICEKQIKLTEAIASLIHDNQNDCDQMGSKLGQLVVHNAALMRKARKFTPEQQRRGKENHSVRGKAASARIADGLTRCQTNANVRAAMEKIHALSATDDVAVIATRR
jgi:PhoPQ-activated pathogenicity-related protein